MKNYIAIFFIFFSIVAYETPFFIINLKKLNNVIKLFIPFVLLILLMNVKKGVIKTGKFSNKECCRIFGLTEPIINLEKYNMFSLLGNGMDINLLMKLILCM